MLMCVGVRTTLRPAIVSIPLAHFAGRVVDKVVARIVWRDQFLSDLRAAAGGEQIVSILRHSILIRGSCRVR